MMATLGRMFPWRGALGECPSGYTHPLASQRIPAVLGLEVEADRKTWLAKEPAAIDRQMAAENVTWGEERIANELKLKLGIRVSGDC